MRSPRRRSTDSVRLFAMPLVVHIALMLVLALVVAGLLGSGLWWGIGQPSIAPEKRPWSAKEVFDFVKIVLTTVGGIGAVVALVVSYRKQRLGETAETREDARLFAEDFAKATEQLGSTEAAVRLAGMYILERLGQDTPLHQRTIVNVLCAYLRMPYTLPDVDPGEEKQKKNKTRMQEREVRVTAQRILATNLRPRETSLYQPWEDVNLDLTGATLINFNLHNCQLDTARFDGAKFSGDAQFGGAQFSGDARFEGAEFNGDAQFAGAEFNGDARFDWTDFSGDAEFGGAEFGGSGWFTGSKFSGGAVFDWVKFSEEAQFDEVEFNGNSSFTWARFCSRAVFSDAEFSGAFFGRVEFERAALFSGAQFSEKALFTETNFKGRAVFDNTDFRGKVFFGEVQFIEGGIVVFSGAQFSGALADGGQFDKEIFDKADFTKRALFDDVQFNGALFGRAYFSRGAIFDGAEFSGNNPFTRIRVRINAPGVVADDWSWPQGYALIDPVHSIDAVLSGRRGRWGYLMPVDTGENNAHSFNTVDGSGAQ